MRFFNTLAFNFSKVGKVFLLSLLITAFFATNVFADSQRLAGDNRYETAVEIAKAGWKQANYAVLAYGLNFPDSVAATPLAKKYDAPVLLTAKDNLTDVTKQALANLQVKHVFIVGGESVISPKVESQVKAMGIKTERLAGADRYETSVRIAEKLGNVNRVIVCTGSDFADALSIGPVAAKLDIPILLVPQNNLPTSVKTYLSSKSITSTIVVGNQSLINDSLMNQFPKAERISGGNKYERNISILKRFGSELPLNTICVATGEVFPDALAGAAYAVKTNSPIVLLPNSSNNSVILNFLRENKHNIKKSIIFGGESAVSKQIANNYLSIKDEQQNPVSGNVVYAGKITQYGQPLSKTPVPGYEKINVLYGYHTYGANNQTQYDQIMAVAREAKAYAESMDLNTNEGWQWIMQYRSGTAPANIKRVVEEYYHKTLLDLPLSELEKVARAQVMESYLNNYNKNPNYDASGESAWDVLFGRGADCNGGAYIESLVFDMWGYNTQIRADNAHAYSMIEINGKWYVYDAALYPFDESHKFRMLVSPTFSGNL